MNATREAAIRRLVAPGTETAAHGLCDEAILDLLAEVEALREIVNAALPALGSHPRDFSQRALLKACDAVGSDADAWSDHPDVLARVRQQLLLPPSVEGGR